MEIIDVFAAGICKKNTKSISIVCPICKTVLLKQTSAPAQMVVCKHVRFRWNSGELIEFFGEWDHSKFADGVLRTLDEDDHIYSYDHGVKENDLSLSNCYVQSSSMIEVLEKIDDTDVLQAMVMQPFFCNLTPQS